MKRRKWAPKDKPTGQAGGKVSKNHTFTLSHFLTSKGFTQPLREGRGFTLLEVMVAVIILGFGLLAIMHLFPIGLRASKISQDTTVATFLAQAKMEELKNTVWSSIVNETKSEISGTIFSQEVTVNELETDLLKRVTVAVFWTNYGTERSVKLVTLRTNYKKTM